MKDEDILRELSELTKKLEKYNSPKTFLVWGTKENNDKIRKYYQECKELEDCDIILDFHDIHPIRAKNILELKEDQVYIINNDDINKPIRVVFENKSADVVNELLEQTKKDLIKNFNECVCDNLKRST